jgi:hypothetical protein
MFAIAATALLLATATSFQLTSHSSFRSVTSLAARSPALPFLERPSKLDGSSPGDFGFDPLGLTDNLPDLNYVKAAEIKHSRVAMVDIVNRCSINVKLTFCCLNEFVARHRWVSVPAICARY